MEEGTLRVSVELEVVEKLDFGAVVFGAVTFGAVTFGAVTFGAVTFGELDLTELDLEALGLDVLTRAVYDQLKETAMRTRVIKARNFFITGTPEC